MAKFGGASCRLTRRWVGARVLVRQAAGSLDPRRRGGDELYELARQLVDWPRLLPPRQCFTVDARVAECTDVPSALLVQKRVRDAICDAVRDARCGQVALIANALCGVLKRSCTEHGHPCSACNLASLESHAVFPGAQ